MGAIEPTDSDINIFFKNKQYQDSDMNKWTEVTLRRLKSTYMNFMTDSGLLTISNSVRTTTKDYIINYKDLNGIGITKTLTLATIIALCSAALQKPALLSLSVLGEVQYKRNYSKGR